MPTNIEVVAEDRDTYYMNMGPQHPSTHGVLRLKLFLDGETIITAESIIGYGHRAHEKMAENRDYLQFLPNTSRVDYLSGMIYNLAYCQAVEKMLGLEVPERAEYIRVIAAERLEEFERLVIGNVIFQERTKGVGIFDPELVQRYALSGPCLRAMGFARDVRKDEPYSIYERFDFEV